MADSTANRGKYVAMAILKYPSIPTNVPAAALLLDTSTGRLWTGSHIIISLSEYMFVTKRCQRCIVYDEMRLHAANVTKFNAHKRVTASTSLAPSLFYLVFHTEWLYLNAVLATVLKGTRVDLFNNLIYFGKQRQLTTGNNTGLFVISKIIFHHKVLHPPNAGSVTFPIPP